MHLVNTDDFETVKGKYIDVIENTPDIEKYARWIYGKHPTDESLKAYIDRGEMYVLTDGEEIAGMAAVALCQGDDYLNISWEKDLPNDEVATVHLLAVCPDHRGKALGIKILEEAMGIAVRNGKKALRLDALKSNLPEFKLICSANVTSATVAVALKNIMKLDSPAPNSDVPLAAQMIEQIMNDNNGTAIVPTVLFMIFVTFI